MSDCKPQLRTLRELLDATPRIARVRRKNGEIRIQTNPTGRGYEYCVPLCRCNTAQNVLSWVCHLSEKTWCDSRILHDFVIAAWGGYPTEIGAGEVLDGGRARWGRGGPERVGSILGRVFAGMAADAELRRQRSELALKLEPLIAAKAKAREATHTEQGYQKSDNPVHTAKELAKIAGVSHDTIAKVLDGGGAEAE